MNVTETPIALLPDLSSDLSIISQSNITDSNGTQPDSGDSSPTQRLWDLRWFPILAAPLLSITIILPLIVGPSIRWLAQTGLKFRKFWRFSIFFGLAVYLTLYYIFRNNRRINAALISVCDGSAWVIAFHRLGRAVIVKKKRVMWSIFVAFASACIVVDEYVTEPFLMGILAWLLLSVMLLFSYGFLERICQWVIRLFLHLHQKIKDKLISE